MKREINIQRDFFENLFLSEDRLSRIYQELILYRFDEVLSSAFPISKTLLKEWDTLIKEFIKSGSNEKLIWKVPNEFRKFVIKNYFIEPYLKELLWIEWIEIKLLMTPKIEQKELFDISKRFELNAKLKKLTYSVHKREFESKNRCYILLYDNNSSIEWLEISEFIYLLLKRKREPLKVAIKSISDKFGIKPKEAKEILMDTLKSLYDKDILIFT
jgi:hypothetical protein